MNGGKEVARPFRAQDTPTGGCSHPVSVLRWGVSIANLDCRTCAVTETLEKADRLGKHYHYHIFLIVFMRLGVTSYFVFRHC